MEKLPGNSSEKERIDFSMAMVRRAFDDRKWGYWVHCDNRLIRIDYWCHTLSVDIEPGKVKIVCGWNSYNDLSDKIDNYIRDSEYIRYEKKEFEENEYTDPETGDVESCRMYEFTFIGEIPVENRIDPEYLETFGNCLEDIMEEITDCFGIFNADRLEM